MIQLKNLILEGSKNIKVLIKGNKDIPILFSVYEYNGIFTFLPKTMTETEKLAKYDTHNIVQSILNLSKILKKLK